MIEYSCMDIIENLKKNWKRMICIWITCLALGITCGFVNIKQLEQIDYSKDDTVIKIVDLSGLARDETFYYNAIIRVRNMHNELNAYTQYLKQVRMSGDSLEKVSGMESLLAAYEDTYQELIEKYYGYYPIIYTDNASEYVDEKIYLNQNRIEQYEAELCKIERQPFVGISSDARRLELENKITKLSNENYFWEKCKEYTLSKNNEQREYNNAVVDELMLKNVSDLNELIQTFNELIVLLEDVEQYDIVYNEYLLKQYTINTMRADELSDEDIVKNEKNEALIYAKSVSDMDSVKESFGAYVLFFCMFGVACSVLYGAFWRKSSVR